MTSEQPPAYGQQDASFRTAGGESGLQRLVDNFYHRLESDERFHTLHQQYTDEPAQRRDKLTRFLCGWLGGPKRYRETYGEICVPAAHAHLPITHTERDAWLQCMVEAIEEQPWPDAFKQYLIKQLRGPTEAIRQRCEPGRQASPGSPTPPAEPQATVWVDADACPVVVRQILIRAAVRTGVRLVFVANQPLPTHPAENIQHRQVPTGFDEADHYIASQVCVADLVITSDIPLAAEVLALGAEVISPRGVAYTPDNIRSKLAMRDFMDTMRSSGVETKGGPSAFGQKEKQALANQLDRFLTRAEKSGAIRARVDPDSDRR